MKPGGSAASAALTRAGVAHLVRPFGPHTDAPAYAWPALAGLGVDPERVLAARLVDVDGAPVLALVPVTRALDPAALAAAVGGRTATPAGASTAERLTGHPAAALSPLGLATDLPVVVDASVVDAPTVLVSAGRRGLALELPYEDLVAVTRARLAPISRQAG